MSESDIAFHKRCDTDDEDPDYDMYRKEIQETCESIGLGPKPQQRRERIPSEEKIPLAKEPLSPYKRHHPKPTSPVAAAPPAPQKMQDSLSIAPLLNQKSKSPVPLTLTTLSREEKKNKDVIVASEEDEDEEEGDEGEEGDNDTSSDNNDDEEDDDVTAVHERMIFLAQQELLFKKSVSKNVYKVHARTDTEQKHQLCFKFTVRHPRHRTNMPIELRILAHLKAQKCTNHVQNMHSYIVAPNSYAFVSPFVPALTDIRELPDWVLRPSRIQKVMQQLFHGLRNVHRAGVMHRDIKPSNLLWDEKREYLILADFGHSTWNTKDGHHIMVGTEGFMAPEILGYERDGGGQPQNYHEKCDIYSAGMVFGALLFGVAEKYVHEFHARLFRQQSKVYYPGPTSKLLHALLRRNPRKRPSARQALTSPYFQLKFAPKPPNTPTAAKAKWTRFFN